MFWRILKRDLKRKKTMNTIILLFVVLASMFASAAVNNIIAVTGGLDKYLELADVPAAVVLAPTHMEEVSKTLSGRSDVKNIRTEPQLVVVESGSFSVDGMKMSNFVNITRIMSDKETGVNYFAPDNSIIESVVQGHLYGNATFVKNSGLQPGDTVKLDVGDSHMSFIFDGQMKDVIMGGAAMTAPRLLISSADYAELEKNPMLTAIWAETFYYVETEQPEAIKSAVDGMSNVYFMDSKTDIKGAFLYDIMLAFVMLVISVMLMLVSFAVIRFSVGFTISEEYHEIGVMKAVGVNNGSIRKLYLVKYLALAVIGAVIGFAASIPLEKVMLDSVTSNIVLEGGNTVVMGLFCSAAVILLILLFCWSCTRRIRKLSAIDAVRSGQTGERFGKKSLLHLGRSKLPATGFLSCNDVLSAPKRFTLVGIIFAFCMLCMTCLSVFADSLASEKLVPFMGSPNHDLTVGEMSDMEILFTDPEGAIKIKAKTEEMLRQEGMPGNVTVSYGADYDTTYGSNRQSICYLVTKGVSAEELTYDAGSAPVKANEVAMTQYALDALGAEIGDTVTMKTGGGEQQLLITGSFSSFQSGGYAARMYEDFEIEPDAISSVLGVQIRFDGNPDSNTVTEYQNHLKEIYNTEKIYTGSEMVKNAIGLSDSMRSMQRLMTVLTVNVINLIADLLERSFISKEKSEIALMKAVGISGSSITLQHTLRFVIVSVIACAVAAVLTVPLSSPIFNFCCSLAGSIKNVKLAYKPAEIYAVCPLIIIGVTAVSAMLTALYTKTVKASDTASIE